MIKIWIFDEKEEEHDFEDKLIGNYLLNIEHG